MPLTPDGLYAGGFGFAGSPLAIERFGSRAHVVMLARGRGGTGPWIGAASA